MRQDSSSYTEPRRLQYRLIEDVEDLDSYRVGGYCPLEIGDRLNCGRYQLVDKLGYGGYSTTWLARDLQHARYVAVKVITADASEGTPEASLLRSLEKSPYRPGKEIIQTLIDEFWIAGSNGKHRCILTSPARMSLFDAKEASTCGLFRPEVARSIIAQLIRRVAFLHHENVVHGDLHLGNVLIQFPRVIDCFSTSQLYKKYGEPQSEAVVRLDGKPLENDVPARVYVPGWFGVPCNEIVLDNENEKIILTDFGESFRPDTELRTSSKTLPLLQPPETRFSDEPLSFPSDIWTLACTAWEIFGARPLFETYFSSADRVVKEQVETLGILPPEWWKDWSRRLEWFNEDGEILPTAYDNLRRTLDMRFEDCIQGPRAEAGFEVVTEEERRAYDWMIRSMLRFRPAERLSAQQLLHSEWMKGWGLPALEHSSV